jgi:hypothetical protein
MFNATKYLAALAELIASVSTKLSIALVLAVAVVSALPREDARPVRASASLASPPLERPSTFPVQAAPTDPEPVVVAARRGRARDERPQAEDEPVRKNSAIATEEKLKGAIPIPASDAKPEAAEAEPPKPDVWSEAEIIAGLRECLRLLGPIAAEVEVEQPLKRDECGAPAPVALRRIYSDAGKVEFSPPATLNCAMVASLHAWVEETLQPTAEELLGSHVVRLRNASGYSCRKRNGSLFNSDKLSEHAKANAVDIAGFVTADGRSIEVAKSWGPTLRDLREAERIAAERAKEAKEAARKAAAAKPQPAKAEPGPTRKPSAIAARARDLKNVKQAAPIQPAEPAKTDATRDDEDDERSKDDARGTVAALAAEREKAAASAEGDFLRRLHKGACATFGTVLGPEANEAHRDHFHFDLAHRRRSAYCQ